MDKDQAQILVKSITENAGWAQKVLSSVQDQADKIMVASERVTKMRAQLKGAQKMSGRYAQDWHCLYSKPEVWRQNFAKINSEFEYAKACYSIANSRISFVMDLMKTVNTLYRVFKDNEEDIAAFVPQVGEGGTNIMEQAYENANKQINLSRKALYDVQEALQGMNYKEIEQQMREDVGQFVDKMTEK